MERNELEQFYPELRSRQTYIPVSEDRRFDEILTHRDTNYSYFTPNESPEEIAVRRYIEWRHSGIIFTNLVAENLICHPFLVLRRQCQVNHNSTRSHIVPFTLLPVVCRLHRHQPLTTLWKGLGSTLLVRGMTLGIEDFLSVVTPWPKELTAHCSWKQIFQHIMLKCISLAIVTPFYSASLVETVQSQVASESPGFFDVFREGFQRLFSWGAPAKARMLPIWVLIVPTVALGLAKSISFTILRGSMVAILRSKVVGKREDLADPRPQVAVQDLEVGANLMANIISDVIFYPYETVVHRLHLQGTRAIIDNLDSGRSVLPILTNYSGAIDCYETCFTQEGKGGLYKGFGALILQYVTLVALMRLSHIVLSKLGKVMLSPEPQPEPPVDESPPAISNVTTSPRSYLLP